MRRAYILLGLGIWIAVLPFLGFPASWKSILVTLSGLGLIYFSFLFYKESRKKEAKKQNPDNFSENRDFNESV